ncbi:hypothetical protein PR202_ga15140 [Eleusine coracana subsp. coracana]|uniref:Serine/threonine-protein phosphatase 2A 55 kDa regulatory subunit B n=1 Tax=Eleusine coracana subsp. coracana TaxID=191504 RepID=A0AAV5CJ93_ELECO|nr:hypothetical protein PR202_ga15140 [Eleusine coracana subsp. coracana]
MDPQASDDGQVAAQPQQQPLEWRFAQVFGERAAGEDVQEVDIISAIEFDRSGDHLATGDKGGRVVLFERTDARDFDYLKSLEIEEKINKIKWCETANNALSLLSTNDKTIKYWKVTSLEANPVARCRRVYAHAHDYHINSISNNSDGETFISADDLRINLWNLEINSQSFNIVDVKPSNMEDLTGPVSTFQVHEHLRPQLCDLYENDSIFDKFECCLSGDGLRVATGSYGNIFRVFGCTPGSTEATTLEASRNPMRVGSGRDRSKINSTLKDSSKSALQCLYDSLSFTCNAI